MNSPSSCSRIRPYRGWLREPARAARRRGIIRFARVCTSKRSRATTAVKSTPTFASYAPRNRITGLRARKSDCDGRMGASFVRIQQAGSTSSRSRSKPTEFSRTFEDVQRARPRRVRQPEQHLCADAVRLASAVRGYDEACADRRDEPTFGGQINRRRDDRLTIEAAPVAHNFVAGSEHRTKLQRDDL